MSAASTLVAASATLPLEGVALRVTARCGIARIVLEQRFANHHAEPLSVTYMLPLPADAAVSGFSFCLGERRIQGEIDRIRTARERYEDAIARGHTAALLVQERSSLFTQEIGNVPPGARVVCEIVLDQRLHWLEDGSWEWRFPLAAAPRYLGDPGRVPDADALALAVAEALSPRASLALAIGDAVAAGRTPESPSHRLLCAPEGAGHRASLADIAVALDRDVVVRWPVAEHAPGVSILAERTPRGAHALLTVVPPRPDARPGAVPRDLIVLLDTSGSMAGAPLEQARRVAMALVHELEDRDTFELIEFSSAPRRFASASRPATLAHRREALAWLAALRADGGTEMRAGILEALRPVRADGQRQIVVITDGLIGFEQEIVQAILERLPQGSRVHMVGVGSSVNRSLTAPAARAGRGAEIVIGLGEDAERAVQRIRARTEAPLVVDVTIAGDALIEAAPARLPDLFGGCPVLVSAKVRPEGGELVVRGRGATGPWEQRVRVAPDDVETSVAATLFGREAVEDRELRLAAGGDRADLDRAVEQLGLDYRISTRMTSWIAVDTAPSVAPGSPGRREIVPQMLPHGMSVDGLGLRKPRGRPAVRKIGAPAPGILDLSPAPGGTGGEWKTRITKVQVVKPAKIIPPAMAAGEACLVLLYPPGPDLGKRYPLLLSEIVLGRSSHCDIQVGRDSVSRRHARVYRDGETWSVEDLQSTNGSYVNDVPVTRSVLRDGDFLKIGAVIFKFLSGAGVEVRYHEELYRLTIVDALTGAYNKRYFLEFLEREIARCARHRRPLSLVMFDIDHFKAINDQHGHLTGDHVLREMSRRLLHRIRREELLARYGGEEFAVVLPETDLAGARTFGEQVRRIVGDQMFEYEGHTFPITISGGVATVEGEDIDGSALIKRADDLLFRAKHEGRNRVLG